MCMVCVWYVYGMCITEVGGSNVVIEPTFMLPNIK